MLESLIDASLYINSSSESQSESEVPLYEKISDKEDVYLIHTKNHSYELHRTRLIDTLKQLHHYASIQISELKEEQSELLASTIETTRLLYNTKALKDLVLSDIQKIYKNIKNPVPGTVGAFFVGCFNNDEFDGPLGCNPRCAASLLKCDINFECGDNILVFSNHHFTSINNKVTTHAYIYIEDEKFQKFSRYEYKLLQDSGIKSITIIYGNADGSYREISKEIILEHIEDEEPNYVWIIILILLLLLIFFIFYSAKYFVY